MATDLDGTLVRSDGTVSDRTAQVLADLEELGVPVVFVTGRPLRWAGRGVAMAQAVEEVREAADAVTGTVHDDGAAVEIERWFG